MKTQFGNVLAAISVAGLLATASLSVSAAQPVDTPEIRAAVQNATTYSDHLAVAKYYEDAAKQLQAKAKEQQALLEQYQNKSYMYGRQAQDLQSHTEALLHKYEQTASATLQEAAAHRQIAAKLEASPVAAGASEDQKLNVVSGVHQNGTTVH
jgi:peptidoglycan hydrolase CwlO-like protein